MKKYIGIFAVLCSVLLPTRVLLADGEQANGWKPNKGFSLVSEVKANVDKENEQKNQAYIDLVLQTSDNPVGTAAKFAEKHGIDDKNSSSSSSSESSIDPINESGKLNRSRTSKKVAVKDLCQSKLGGTNNPDIEYCEYISPIYGICDTHVYNAGKIKNVDNDTDRENMDDIIATKVTVLSQQMYKQYEYLSATLHRIETQLNKAVLTAQLEMAGAKSDGSSGGSSRSNDKEIVLAGAGNCWNESSPSGAYRCIQQNANLVKSNAQTNRKQAREQLKKTIDAAKQWGVEICEQWGVKDGVTVCSVYKNCDNISKADEIIQCANSLSIGVARKLDAEEKERLKYSSGRY